MKHQIPLLLACCAATLHAEVTLPPVISDHMVLQRDVPAPIWGKASPGEEVAVSIAGQSKSTKADEKGGWKVSLDPLQAAEGLTLTVKGSNTLTIQDVLVGEVWLGSGQSNMAGPVRTFKGADEGLQKTLAAAPYPRIRLMKQGAKGWQPATPANVDAFSAILFAFGSRLQTELNVPVGLMVGAVGGTPSGFWLTEEMFRGDAACQAQIKEFAKTYDFAAAMKAYERYMTAWKANAEKAKQSGGKVGREPAVPLQPGECSGEIGHLYQAHVQPYVPYAIRGVLWDQGEGGTGITGVDQFHVMGALIKGWRKAWQQDFPFIYMQKPSGGGTAWDLANPTTKNADAFAPTPAKVPADIEGQAREVHIKIQQHPHTAMVISTDLGGMTHPTNKSGYADRAKQVALSFVYGGQAEFSGPLYASHSIEGGKVRIKFSHIGRGLATRHSDQLQGFIIAGADKQFHWADAVIEGDSVIVSSAAVPQPAAVRYAWSSQSPWASLFNKDGLPAQTFRTDDWSLLNARK
ncbi:sialate O-acetylesterase [Prosthecobacter sp.]|uniref:sialate O-acetylesterase n=1 Tax=Prosthecobacter sp. TaxID=1965333 RepID=UPI0037833E27